MHYVSEAKWNKIGITAPIHRFLYLRWRELLDERTYVSWQIRTSDPRSTCVEVRQSIEITGDVPNHHPNIRLLVDELIDQLKALPKSNNVKSHVIHAAEKLREAYLEKAQSGDGRSLNQLRSLLRKVDELLSTAKRSLIAEIERILISKTNEKALLDRLISQLAATLRNEGYSYFYLKSLYTVFERDEAFSNRISLFSHLITRTPQTYVVHFLAKVSEADFTQYDSSNLYKVIDRDSLDPSSAPVSTFLSQDRSGVIVKFDVSALDQFSALSEARTRLIELTQVDRLYRRKRLFTRIHDRILVISPDEQYHWYNEREINFVEPYDSQEFQFHFERHLNRLGRIGDSERTLIGASIRYYNVAMSASDNDLRFLNLWIALETLFQQADGDSIIGRIRKALPTLVASNYVTDLARELSKDIVHASGQTEFSAMSTTFPESRVDYIDPLDLISALCDKKSGPAITALLGYVSGNELLCHRVYRMWESTFHSRETFIRSMAEHQMTIERQIVRLYRTRNTIMHRGQTPNDVSYLSHHLHLYFRTAIHKVLACLDASPTNTVMDAMVSVREDYDYVIKQIKERKEISTGQIHTMSTRDEAGRIVWQTGT